jgi:hypothetical protein
MARILSLFMQEFMNPPGQGRAQEGGFLRLRDNVSHGKSFTDHPQGGLVSLPALTHCSSRRQAGLVPPERIVADELKPSHARLLIHNLLVRS